MIDQKKFVFMKFPTMFIQIIKLKPKQGDAKCNLISEKGKHEEAGKEISLSSFNNQPEFNFS